MIEIKSPKVRASGIFLCKNADANDACFFYAKPQSEQKYLHFHFWRTWTEKLTERVWSGCVQKQGKEECAFACGTWWKKVANMFGSYMKVYEKNKKKRKRK